MGEFKNIFNDKLIEKNTNMLKCIYNKQGLKQNYNWEFSLRGDRAKKQRISPMPTSKERKQF